MDKQGYKYAIGFTCITGMKTFEHFDDLGEDRKVYEVRAGNSYLPRVVVLCNRSSDYIPYKDGDLEDRTIVREILPKGGKGL